MRAPKERFSDRVADFVKYRPGYREEIVRILEREASIAPGQTRVADIGAGTGISSELFARAGYDVVAVEPNDAMRAALPLGVSPIAATAEATTLDAGSIDLAFAAQAFHWFDRAKFKAELARILARGGICALAWNVRRVDTSFLREYEDALMRLGIDYDKVRHENIGEDQLRTFFGGTSTHRSVPNYQDFDREGLFGRATSSSYVPKKGQANHDELMRELDRIFRAHAENGRVRFGYDTEPCLPQRSPTSVARSAFANVEAPADATHQPGSHLARPQALAFFGNFSIGHSAAADALLLGACFRRGSG